MGDLTKSRFDPKTFDSDVMLNHHLSQKYKLIGRETFNHLIITLTNTKAYSLRRQMIWPQDTLLRPKTQAIKD